MTERIELNRELVNHPAAILAIVVEDYMKDCGIDDEDLHVIEKSFEPHSGRIIVAYVDGEFCKV